MKSLRIFFQKSEILSIVLTILFVGNVAKAQYPYNFSYAGFPIDSRTIVRHYDELHAVVYYEDAARGYVSLVDVVTNDARVVPLDYSVRMNDMCILNDSVFLCGRETLPNGQINGCIATMDINNFYTSSVLVTYYNPSYWVLMDLKRIKGYKYTLYGYPFANFLLVADVEYPCDGSDAFPTNLMNNGSLIHVYYTDSNDHSTCIVNAVLDVGYPFPTSQYSHNIIRFINTTDHFETIHDVVETDNYVAFVGVESGSADSITLHICDKSNYILLTPYILSLTNNFDNYYTYPLGTNSGSPFYHACALDGDMIAIASQDETSPSNKISIRTFDLSTHTMTNSQQLLCNSHPDLKDIAYIPDLHQIVLLHHGYFNSTIGYSDIFCTVDPYNGGPTYTRPGMAEDVLHLKFGSLDAMKNTYFISTGGEHGFVSDAGNFSPHGTCYRVEDYNIFRIDDISPIPATYDYDKLQPRPPMWYGVEEPVQVELPSKCINIK